MKIKKKLLLFAVLFVITLSNAQEKRVSLTAVAKFSILHNINYDSLISIFINVQNCLIV